MAYNFKSIADVEVVAEPAETANVLIEENGVIKKAPKTAVGGAGDNEADLVIAVNSRRHIKITSNTFYIEHGSVNAVLDAIRDERIPDIRMRFYYNADAENIGEFISFDYDEIKAEYSLYGERIYLYYITGAYGDRIYNGSLTLGFDDSFYASNLYYVAGTVVS